MALTVTTVKVVRVKWSVEVITEGLPVGGRVFIMVGVMSVVVLA